jgi:oxygen-independent coproporphyrinogen-3 oxidase
MDARDLIRLGRASTVEQNRAALHEVGRRFTDWSADAILGIPGSTPSRLEATLGASIEAGAPHLSFYCLEMPDERARRFGDPRTPESESRKATWYERASSFVTAHGFEHYEISSAARPGHTARHNRGYWNRRPYVGLGPGAHSFDPGRRSWNLPHLEAYVAALEAGSPPADRHEVLDAETESIDLSLRQAEGLELAGDLELIPANFWIELDRHGLGALRDGRVRLTTRGWLVSDSIVLQILALLDAAPGSVDKPRRASVH